MIKITQICQRITVIPDSIPLEIHWVIYGWKNFWEQFSKKGIKLEIKMNKSYHDLRFIFLKRATTLGQQPHGAQRCLLGAWRSWRMSVPSDGVTVLQESPATLSLSPMTSSTPTRPLTATVHWSNDTRARLGCGNEVCGLSTDPCRSMWEMGAPEREGGRGVSRSGGRRGFWQWQHRRHAKRDLRHAEESIPTSTMHSKQGQQKQTA